MLEPLKHKVEKFGPYLLKQFKMKHNYVEIFLSFKQQPLLNNESHLFLYSLLFLTLNKI